jgi:hypothetical protein
MTFSALAYLHTQFDVYRDYAAVCSITDDCDQSHKPNACMR